MDNKRLTYIDTAKFIGILLVIVGHCGNHITLLGQVAYSFHMPLFFIISGMFIKDMQFTTGGQKYAKRLLIPYAITSFLTLIAFFVCASCNCDNINEVFSRWVITTVFATAAPDYGKELFSDIEAAGPIWFLFALFWANWIYSYLKTKCDRLMLLTISLSLFVFSSLSLSVIKLPFSIQAGIGAVIFLFIGECVRNYNIIDRLNHFPLILKVALFLTWLIPMYKGALVGMPVMLYTKGIISFICAVAGSIVLMNMSKIFTYFGGRYGKYTLSLLCAHSIAWNCFYYFGNPFVGIISGSNIIVNFLIEFLCQVLIAVLGSILLTKLPISKKYFI